MLDKDDTGQVRIRLSTIEGSARQALAEMRRLLELLDQEHIDDDGDCAESLPQLGVGHLEELSQQVTASGLPVRLTVHGNVDDLPPGLDLAAYRIVQEALTNSLKHAGPALAAVTVSRSPDALEIVVADDGRGGPALDSGGRGLPGMRQRAHLYGGELELGPRPGGGFRVRAVFPVPAMDGSA